jgi:hypothetical protein
MLKSLLLVLFLLLTTQIVVTYRLNLMMNTNNVHMDQLCEGLCNDLIRSVNEKLPISSNPSKQYWLAIAGGIFKLYNLDKIYYDSSSLYYYSGPGAGKSTISTVLCDKLNSKGYETVVLPMDGYHYSRLQLQEIAKSNSETSYDQLLIRRGAEWTFDAELFVNDLIEAKRNGFASLPVYRL